MYKNFSLNNKEKKEIMEMHKSHGYKKPINELRGEMFSDEEGYHEDIPSDIKISRGDEDIEISRSDLSMVVAIARKWCEGKENFDNCQEIDNLYRKHQLFM